MQASDVFLDAEEASLRVPEQYSAAAAEALSFGTFLRVHLAGKDTADGSLAKMLRWLYTNAEFSAAALATELSVTRWSDDDHFGFGGDHAWLPGVLLCQPAARHSWQGSGGMHDVMHSRKWRGAQCDALQASLVALWLPQLDPACPACQVMRQLCCL